jgi:hypothetical protein
VFDVKIPPVAALIPCIGLLCGAVAPSGRIGLKCSGQTKISSLDSASFSEEHYVIDRIAGKMISRDPLSGETITTYALTVEPRMYRGTWEADGRTNGGVRVHHKEEAVISRVDGMINLFSISTTFFPNGPSSQELTFTGKCGREDPNSRAPLKF